MRAWRLNLDYLLPQSWLDLNTPKWHTIKSITIHQQQLFLVEMIQ